MPTSEEPADSIDDVEIAHERFVSLREYIAAEYDGDPAPNFALRDIARLEPNRYVVSVCRQRGGAAK